MKNFKKTLNSSTQSSPLFTVCNRAMAGAPKGGGKTGKGAGQSVGKARRVMDTYFYSNQLLL